MPKILHAADLHLDAPFSGLRPEQAQLRRREQRQLVSQLFALADEQDCELVLLAGDLFDSDNAFPETIEALTEACGKSRAEIVIAPGNHDCCVPGSAYLTADWPENVHIFKENRISYFDFPHLSCRVYGAAFTSMDCPALLDGFHAEPGRCNLMVLHGDAVNAASSYDPIAKRQIAASGLDYLALGHVHQQSGLLREGATFYAWPGCFMGRGFDELGEKGVYIVTAERGSCRLQFVPLSGRKYEILRVEAGSDPLTSIIASLPEDASQDVYRIILTGECEKPDLAAISAALEHRFFSLTLRDETRPGRDLWAGIGDDTLRGLYLRRLKSLYDSVEDETARRTVLMAVRYGCDAMDGREAVL